MKKLMATVMLAIVVSALMSCGYVVAGVASMQTAKSSALSSRVIATATAQAETVTITGSWHVRACASVECSVVGYAYDGDTLDLLAEANGWYQVSNDDITGWVKDDCCEAE